MYLHLYAQDSHHDDAQIMGDRESLIALREAIDEALAKDEEVAIEAFVNDGEGYQVHVTCLDNLDSLLLPYTTYNISTGC